METQAIIETINVSTTIIILAIWLTYFGGKADVLEAAGKEESAKRYNWAGLILLVITIVRIFWRNFL